MYSFFCIDDLAGWKRGPGGSSDAEGGAQGGSAAEVFPAQEGIRLRKVSEAAAFERVVRKGVEKIRKTAALASPEGPGEGAFAAAGMDSPPLHFL